MPDLNKDHKKKLIDRYVAGEASYDELVAFFGLLNANELDLVIEEHMSLEVLSILKGRQAAKNQKTLLKYLTAASILLFLGFGSYSFFKNTSVKQQIAKNKIREIVPGGNKAILTLANGKKIVLGDAKNGTLAKQGAITINKTRNGQITYTAAASANQNQQTITYNSIETPRGGQYHITLGDGSDVWLNAASSIKYPTAFNGNERRVEITGEAYFEVKHNSAKPFRVVCNGQIIEDRGTHFNINAYSDENAVKTTLLEGSVAVLSAGKNKILKPGEQAQLKNGNILITNVDVDEVVAWKDGLFDFSDADIGTVMRQLSRWYDVDIKYEGSLPNREFSGAISRNIKLSTLLDMLSFKKIHYKIDGKTIVVMP